MDYKSLGAFKAELDTKGEGTFRAVIARFNVVDHDGDVTLPGAFKSGEAVRVAQWGHNWSSYVIGRGVLGADDTKAWVDGEFYLDTSLGKDTYTSVKRTADLQEWSYGYDTTESSTDEADLAPWQGATRVLKALKVHEASPVMLGAGIGTGTESIKGRGDATLAARVDQLLADTPALIEHVRASVSMRAKEGRVLSSANRTRLSRLHETWTSGLAELAALLADTDREADDPEKARRALAVYDLDELASVARRLGVPV